MDSVRVVGLMNGREGGTPRWRSGRCALGHVEFGFGYFDGMVPVHTWSMHFHTPWGVDDHLRSLRTCAFTPLAAIVSQSINCEKEERSTVQEKLNL